MVVGICKLDLMIPGCRSLKEKRRALRRIKDRTRSEFRIPVAEVGHGDLWQRAELGFAAVGNDRRVIEGLIAKMQDFIEGLGVAQIIDQHTELINI
ncbi:MAG: DUF503 domain-containing protein [Proteobacteria bacterium]|nr:DUF503 domain-containing protein [Pseudomonadota bacterium]